MSELRWAERLPPDAPGAVAARGHTPLMLAAAAGDLPRIHALLADRAAAAGQLAAHDRAGWLPLLHAAAHGHTAALQALAAAGAPLDARGRRDGVTALMLAARAGAAEACGWLLARAPALRDALSWEVRPRTAAVMAAHGGDVATLEVLRGGLAHADGATLAHAAAASGRLPALQFCLTHAPQ